PPGSRVADLPRQGHALPGRHEVDHPQPRIALPDAMIFELRRGRRAGGAEPGEARAEMIFELRRGRRAGGAEPGEARAEMIFELRRGRGAGGAEPGEARAEIKKDCDRTR